MRIRAILATTLVAASEWLLRGLADEKDHAPNSPEWNRAGMFGVLRLELKETLSGLRSMEVKS